MGDPRPEIYTSEDLDFINAGRRRSNLPPIDKYGDISGDFPEPSEMAAQPSPKVDAGAGAELRQGRELEDVGRMLSAEEIDAQEQMEEAFRSLTQEKAKGLLSMYQGGGQPPYDIPAPGEPGFAEKIAELALDEALADTEKMQAIVPGFTMEGWGDNPPEMPVGGRALQYVFGIVAEPFTETGEMLPVGVAAPPMEQPPEAAGYDEPTLMMALAPQSRIGPVRAERAEQLSAAQALKSPEEYAKDQGLDLDAHLAGWQADEIEAKMYELGGTLSDEETAEVDRLRELERKVDEGEIVTGANQLAGYRGFYDAYHLYVSQNPDATAEEAVAAVQAELEMMETILSGEAGPEYYTEHRAGSKGPADPWYRAFATQVTHGQVPNLTDIQKAYLNTSISERRKAFVETMPYRRREQIAQDYGGDPEDIESGMFDYGAVGTEVPEIEGEEGAITWENVWEQPIEAFAVTEEQTLREYRGWLEKRGLTDFWAIDFWDDPEKYGSGYWWNRSYPSGAAVEGPAQWGLRSILVLPNIASRGVYDVATGIGDWTGYSEAAERRQEEDPNYPELYKGHPYLRNIAQNRGLMSDMYDLYAYTPGLEEYAWMAGAAGLGGDIFVAPFDPGLSALTKGGVAGVRGYKTAGALGRPFAGRAGAGTESFFRGAAEGLGDTSMVMNAGLRRWGGGLQDPITFASRQSAHYLDGQQAYRHAMKSGVGHDEALTVAQSQLGRKNRFLADAERGGEEWAAKNIENLMNESSGYGRLYNSFVDEVDDFARTPSGSPHAMPNKRTVNRLVDEAYDANPEFRKFVDNLVERGGIQARGTKGWTDEALEEIVRSSRQSNPKMMNTLLQPLNYKMAQHWTVSALESSPLWKRSFTKLSMVTPSLFVQGEDLARLGKLVGEAEQVQYMVRLMDDAQKIKAIKHGLHPSWDPRVTGTGRASFRPKVGSYIELSVDQRNAMRKYLDDLYKRGLLTQRERMEVLSQLYPDMFARKFGRGIIEEQGLPFWKGQSFISTDSLRRLMNAHIEDVAAANRIGVGSKALDEATTATKAALLEPIGARHLNQNWLRRFLGRGWNLFKDTKKWAAEFPEGMPLHAVVELKKLQGKLAAMDVGLRRDLAELLRSKELQARYFDDDWLMANPNPTRDDCLVALSLGPKSSRSTSAIHTSTSNLSKLMMARTEDLVLDITSVFKQDSIMASSIVDTLSETGKARLQELLSDASGRSGYMGGTGKSITPDDEVFLAERWADDAIPVEARVDDELVQEGPLSSFMTVNGYEDWMGMMGRFHDDLGRFIRNPENFNSPKVVQLAEPDFNSISAGFYYMQQMGRLSDEAMGNIYRSWEGYDAILASNKNLNRLLQEASSIRWADDPEISTILRQEDIAGETGRAQIGDALAARIETMVNVRARPNLSAQLPRSNEDDWSQIVSDIFPRLNDEQVSRIVISLMDETATEPRMLLMGIKDSLDEMAVQIIRINGLNRGNTNEIMDALSSMWNYLKPTGRGRTFPRPSRRIDLSTKPAPKRKGAKVSHKQEYITTQLRGMEESLARRWTKRHGGDAPSPELMRVHEEIGGVSRVDAETHLDEALGREADAQSQLRAFESGQVRPERLEDLQRELDASRKGLKRFQGTDDQFRTARSDVNRILDDIDLTRQRMTEVPDIDRLDELQRILDNASAEVRSARRVLDDLDEGPMSVTVSARQMTEYDELLYREFVQTLERHIMGRTVKGEVDKIGARIKPIGEIRQALLALFKTDKTGAYMAGKALGEAIQWLQTFRYSALLGARAAFHAVNMFTAPQIIWGTLGGRAAVASMSPSKLGLAHRIWQVGNPGKGWREVGRIGAPDSARIALTDAMGRKYTYGDIWEMALGTGGLRSQTRLILGAGEFKHILDDARFSQGYRNFVTKGLERLYGPIAGAGIMGAKVGSPLTLGAAHMGGAVAPIPQTIGGKVIGLKQNPYARFLANMTEYEDQYFRLTQVIHALKRGDDPLVAVGAGRRALFDYGSLTSTEKFAVQRFMMFWAFFRLNMLNTMGVLLSKPKRFANIYRTVQAPTKLREKEGRVPGTQYRFGGSFGGYDTAELDFYSHHFLLTRPMLSYFEGADKQSHYTFMPPVPILDAAVTAAEIMMAPNWDAAIQPFRDYVNPDLKLILGQRSRIQWKKKYVDPKDIYLFEESQWGDWFWNTMIKEQPTRTPAVAGEEHYGGFRYTLSDEGMERYLYFKNTLGPFLTLPSVMGTDTIPLTHMVTGGGTGMFGKQFGEEGEGDVLGTLGLVRKVGTIPITAQRTMLLKELEKRLKQMEEDAGIIRGEQQITPGLTPVENERIRKVRERQRQREQEQPRYRE